MQRTPERADERLAHRLAKGHDGGHGHPAGSAVMMRLADLITQFEPELLQRHGARLLPSQRQALAALKTCRTRFARRMLAACAGCHTQACLAHSCGHRACPHCQHHQSTVWLQRQLKSRVPATYFLLTFTLPAQLRALAWSHQRTVYETLMRYAWDTLKTFSQNDKHLGGIPGALAVLHTHTTANWGFIRMCMCVCPQRPLTPKNACGAPR